LPGSPSMLVALSVFELVVCCGCSGDGYEARPCQQQPHCCSRPSCVPWLYERPLTHIACGFVLCAAGPSGSSVREIVRLSGADINSWTEATGSHRGRRPARIFLIKVGRLLSAVAGFNVIKRMFSQGVGGVVN
jgi:hypothetical protein